MALRPDNRDPLLYPPPPPISLPLSLFLSLSHTHSLISLFISLHLYLYLNLSIHLSPTLSISLCLSLSVCLSVYLSVYIYIYIYICIYIYVRLDITPRIHFSMCNWNVVAWHVCHHCYVVDTGDLYIRDVFSCVLWLPARRDRLCCAILVAICLYR